MEPYQFDNVQGVALTALVHKWLSDLIALLLFFWAFRGQERFSAIKFERPVGPASLISIVALTCLVSVFRWIFWNNQNIPLVVALAISLDYFFFFLCASFYFRRIGVTFSAIFRLPKLQWSQWLIAALAMAAVLRIDNFICVAFRFGIAATEAPLIETVVRYLGSFPMAMKEELWFRGIIQVLLAEKIGVKRSLIFTSFLFAVGHVPKLLGGLDTIHQQRTLFLSTYCFITIANWFFAGLFYGWIFNRTKSIWISTLIHTAGNTQISLVVTWTKMLAAT
jgi:membrane protease YdiL (CAAX protease family)